MHLAKFTNVMMPAGDSLHALIRSAFAAVDAKEVLPSMRSLQFGGEAIEKNNARIYNCSFSYCDRVEFLREAFWLLLCGTGTGFSVQKHHVAKLPALAQQSGDDVRPFLIPDTIEGWADAMHHLLMAHIAGARTIFFFDLIREEGTPLKTSGGKAPGPEPLRLCLSACEKILLGAAGRQLSTVESFDLVCHAAKAVLSGGIRRSACITLFSPDDDGMINAKTGQWFVENPQRSAANISALLLRSQATREQFQRIFEAQKEFGEPGFYFAESTEYGCNPCCEIGLHPRVLLTEASVAKLRAYGYAGELTLGDWLSGWQVCNLTTMAGSQAQTPERFFALCAHAAVIGTLQAAYTAFGYLGAVSQVITENEALLGVSICGVLDNPTVLLEPAVLETGARIVRETNAAVAAALGINPAARLTAVKPEGTSSLLLGSGSGIHPHHARRYFRRVQSNFHEPVFQHVAAANPGMVETSVYDPNGRTKVLTFCAEAPAHALLKAEVSALKLLSIVALVQKHWVQEGRSNQTFSPGLHHNVSNTVTVCADEWTDVANFIWDRREQFTGVALLQEFGDTAYAQAPLQAVTTPEDIARWAQMRREYVAVDYANMHEEDDTTELKQTVACSAGACAL
jgi:ribonucleoside-diphosphate reductase alpha chain